MVHLAQSRRPPVEPMMSRCDHRSSIPTGAPVMVPCGDGVAPQGQLAILAHAANHLARLSR